MKDLIDNYYTNKNIVEYDDIDSQQISKSAIESVLPLILKNDLTERQRVCLKMRYVQGLGQTEIARRLHLSQPTVCRHISLAKAIVNNRLSYCIVALNRANNLWLKWENSKIT